MTEPKGTPAEVWCRRCDQPSVEEVDGEAYCATHASDELWKRNAPAWNPERTMKAR